MFFMASGECMGIRDKTTRLDSMKLKSRGRTNRVFGKPCFCLLPKRVCLDENGENDELAFYPLKTMVWLLRPPKTTKMTKMAGVTQERHGLEKAGFVLP